MLGCVVEPERPTISVHFPLLPKKGEHRQDDENYQMVRNVPTYGRTDQVAVLTG